MNTQPINTQQMNTHTFWTRPVKAAVLAFLGTMVAATAVGLANRMGVIDSAVTKRSIGLVIGVMIVITGNFLPKLKPLNSSGSDPARATTAERFSGWALVLAGVAYVGSFVFAPLEQARLLSSIIGIGAMLVVAAIWVWLARGMLSHGRQLPDPTDLDATALSRQSAEKRRLVVVLLFAFFWVLATACTSFLLGDKPWVKEFGSWMMVGFCFIYAGLTAVFDSRRCRQ